MKSYKGRLLATAALAALLAGLAVNGISRARPEADEKKPPREKPKLAVPTEHRQDDQAIRKQAAAYTEALKKGDLDAILSFWAPDADYVDDTGKTYKGHDALRQLFSKALKDIKGSRLNFQIQSLRFLRPEVALEDGCARATAPEGTCNCCRYSAIWVKSGDRWLLGSVRDLSAETEGNATGPYRHLRELEWLVGEWQSEDKKRDVHLTASWAPNRNFLLMEYRGRKSDDSELNVSDRVGWDPAARQFHSWMFDTAGGFGEAYWKRDGNQWLIKSSGVLPDGRKGTSTNTYQFVDENHCVWRSRNRQVDGLPTADIELKLVRVPKK